MKQNILLLAWLSLIAATTNAQSNPNPQSDDTAKQQSLWQKLESTITGIDRNLHGVLGVAIEDLNTGKKFLLRPTQSSRKPAP